MLDRLVEAKLFSVTVSGGEPFTRPDLPEILGEIVSRPLRLSINTNATLVGRREAAMLASLLPRLDRVMISLDGPDPETHDRLRGTGSFEAAVRGARCLLAEGVKLGFCCTATSLNAGRLAEVADLALSLGEWIVFNAFVHSGPCLPAGLSLDPAGFRDSCEAAFALAGRWGRRVRGSLVETAASMREIRSGLAEGGRDVCGGHSCGGCATLVAVLPDGCLAPCDHFPAVRLGSLLDSSLEAIMESEPARAFRARVEAPLSDSPECEGCRYLGVCRGGCPVTSWGRPGPLGPDPLSCPRRYLEEPHAPEPPR